MEVAYWVQRCIMAAAFGFKHTQMGCVVRCVRARTAHVWRRTTLTPACDAP
jgi:hypothetical protein